jgi:DNA-binding response OmpR family regulator
MTKRKILVVDDEEDIIMTLTRRLEANNYEVITARDGAEGLEKTLNEKPDLIISDIMMPQMDGYTFIKKLRAERFAAHIPVIILTAKEKMQDLFLFQGVKDCDYLVKPFEAANLLQKIEQLLERVRTYVGLGPQTETGHPAS